MRRLLLVGLLLLAVPSAAEAKPFARRGKARTLRLRVRRCGATP